MTIDVKPGEGNTAVPVVTKVLDNGQHLPVYAQSDAEGVAIDEDNPLPIESIRLYSLTRDIRDTNQEIIKQLKLMNSHFAEWDGDEHDDD